MHSRKTIFETRRTALDAQYRADLAKIWADTVERGADGSDPEYLDARSRLYVAMLAADNALCRANSHGTFGFTPSF